MNITFFWACTGLTSQPVNREWLMGALHEYWYGLSFLSLWPRALRRDAFFLTRERNWWGTFKQFIFHVLNILKSFLFQNGNTRTERQVRNIIIQTEALVETMCLIIRKEKICLPSLPKHLFQNQGQDVQQSDNPTTPAVQSYQVDESEAWLESD